MITDVILTYICTCSDKCWARIKIWSKKTLNFRQPDCCLQGIKCAQLALTREVNYAKKLKRELENYDNYRVSFCIGKTRYKHKELYSNLIMQSEVIQGFGEWRKGIKWRYFFYGVRGIQNNSPRGPPRATLVKKVLKLKLPLSCRLCEINNAKKKNHENLW